MGSLRSSARRVRVAAQAEEGVLQADANELVIFNWRILGKDSLENDFRRIAQDHRAPPFDLETRDRPRAQQRLPERGQAAKLILRAASRPLIAPGVPSAMMRP